MNKHVMLIGGGRMGRAMAQGMIRGGVLSAERLCVIDRNPQSRTWWAENVPGAVIAAPTEMEQPPGGDATIAILAVKPNHLEQVIATARNRQDDFWKRMLVVSVAAGVSLDRLTTWSGSRRVARVMPNTPSLVGAGASAYCCAEDVDAADEQDLRTVLDSFGTSAAVPEYQMDAVTGLSGSGPAYVFMFIEALADGGVLAGLPRATAMQMAVQTVLGAAKMVAETGDHPGVLKDAVASPGGTTIAAIRALEHNAFRGTIIDAVMASATRSREISSR